LNFLFFKVFYFLPSVLEFLMNQ